MSAPEREPAEPRETSRTADKAELARYYNQMLAIRPMEEALAKAYALRKFGGFLHLYVGQEAVAAFTSRYRGDGRVTLCFFGE